MVYEDSNQAVMKLIGKLFNLNSRSQGSFYKVTKKEIKMLNAVKSRFSSCKKLLFLLFIIRYSLLTAYSQVNLEWVSRYNGTGNGIDQANSIVTDALSNVYVTGYSRGLGTNEDYATIKYNSSGIQLWEARYSEPGNSFNVANSITVDLLGNVYVTGSSEVLGASKDYATVKYNPSGTEQWVARYDGYMNSVDVALFITVDLLSNVYVTGESWGNGTQMDYATVKYNSSGIQQWVARYNGPGNNLDGASSIVVDLTGNVYVTGWSHGIGTNEDYATIKYNSSGIQQWVARYNGPGNDFDDARSIKIDVQGNVYITGFSTGSGTSQDYATIKYNPSGIEQWVARYNGSANDGDRAYSVAVDASGNLYVTGWSGNGTNFDWDYATIKYNSSGVQQWAARYNGPGNTTDWAHCIAVDLSGNVYVTGESLVSGSNWDYATIKYSAAGSEQWVERYNGPGNGWDKAFSVVVDSSSVYVTGCSSGLGTSLDYASIKYSQLIGIQPISNEIPDKLSLSQNYPNPFNPATIIRFHIPLSRGVSEGRGVSLIIYDMLGREIATLVDEDLKPGIYEMTFDGAKYPSGVYYYKLSAGNYFETKKMVLIK